MFRALMMAGLLFIGVCGLARGDDPSLLAGSWKLSLPTGRSADEMITLLIGLKEQDGKWVGEYLASTDKLVAEPTVKSLQVSGDAVRFSIELKGQELLSFDGTLSKDKKKIAGSLSLVGQPLTLTELYPSKLKKLDEPFELARETVAQVENGPALFEAALQIVNKAQEKKLPREELRTILDRTNKAAAGYGPRWEREMTLRLARSLAGQSELGDLAVAQAKRAERLLSDDDSVSTRISVLEALIDALTRAKKADEAKPYLAQIAKLETRDFAEYARTSPLKTEAYAGRKTPSDRAMLVEVFTGAECPPCVAADLAFDGLMKTFKPTEAIFLQYHLHIPRPDPLTCPDGEERAEQSYGKVIQGTPTVLVSGKTAEAGGPASRAQDSYQAIRGLLEAGLAKPAAAKIALSLSKDDKGLFSARASVSDLETPGEKIKLRFALAEERVRYTGGNGLRYHHMVVRAMPGGVNGFALTKKTSEQTVSFDPQTVRNALNTYLDDLIKNEKITFPHPERPLALKNLKLVAFIQNDETREVLQAAQVDVEGK